MGGIGGIGDMMGVVLWGKANLSGGTIGVVLWVTPDARCGSWEALGVLTMSALL